MFKSIDSFIKKIDGQKIHFIIIINRIAWYWDYKGKRYGEFMNIDMKEMKQYSSELIKGAIDIITDQVKATIKEIKNK